MNGYPIGKNYAVQKMIGVRISGNVVPPNWFRVLKLSNGKPDSIGVMLLADIVYWYRPIEVRDEETGLVTGYRKKFAADKLQRSYSAFADMYGYTKEQVRDALKRIEKHGVIDLDFRHPTINGIKMGNLLYIGLNVARLTEITTPLSALKDIGCGDESPEPLAFKADTNTETTTENSTVMGASAPEQPSLENEEAKTNTGTIDTRDQLINAFPADVRDMIRTFYDATGLPIPARPQRSGKGGLYALSINGARELNELLKGHESDAHDVITAAVMASNGLTISHPGALTKFVAAEVGKLVLQKRAQSERKQSRNLVLSVPQGVDLNSMKKLPTDQEIWDIAQEQGWDVSQPLPGEKFWPIWRSKLERAEVM